MEAIQEQYDRLGYAPLDMKVSEKELAEIDRWLEQRRQDNHPGNVLDDAGNLRAVHGYDVGTVPELLEGLAERARYLLGCEAVYVYQFRVNAKAPAEPSECTGKWKPHRDYDFWKGMDGMPEPNAVLFHVLLTDNDTVNGPVICCDGTHKMSPTVTDSKKEGWSEGFKEDLKYTVPDELVQEAEHHTRLVGPRGTLVAMHPLLWHYSEPNRSDKTRTLMTIVMNDVKNVLVTPEGKSPRPPYITCPPSLGVWRGGKTNKAMARL